MNKEQLVVLQSHYELYLDVVKPLIAQVETYFQKFPQEILNEIRSFTDHVARCYERNVTIDYIDEQIDKAASHLNRTILDCYKFLNTHFYDEHKKFEKICKRVDIEKISNGTFYIEYRRLLSEALERVRTAKVQEARNIKVEERFSYYESAYNSYISLMGFIEENHGNIVWAQIRFAAKIGVKIVIWLIGIAIGWVLNSTLGPTVQQVWNSIFK